MRKNDSTFSATDCFLRSTIMLVSLLLVASHLNSQPLASGHGKFLGNVYGNSPGTNWEVYWNQITPENAGKWQNTETSKGVLNWVSLDQIYNYAVQRGLPFKYHNFVWGQQYPSWIGTATPEEIRVRIEELIHQAGLRYPKMDYVDVVNEPLHAFGTSSDWPYAVKIKEALGGNGTTGWDWVIKAFEYARKYCSPSVKLVLNEYSVINSDSNTDQLIVIINLLKSRGLIDVIGVQGHRFELEGASVTTLKGNLNKLAVTGVPIHITEFDIAPQNVLNDAQQLTEYQRIFPVLWEHPGVTGITLWGYIQGQIWQTSAYLVRSDGTERPALQWLRNYLSKGNYRSAKSGKWNEIATWEKNDGAAWVAATSTPTLADQAITISSGDTVAVTASDSADQFIVASGGTLTIDSAATFLVKNGEGTDLTVIGTLSNRGTITSVDSATINFGYGGKYVHPLSAGSIPVASWGNGSTCEVIGYTSGSKPSNLNQNFYSFTWNCPGQSADVDWGWFNNTIGGNITVTNSGSSMVQLTSPGAGNPNTITINGNINVAGGALTSNGSSSGADITINTQGNVAVTGGDFSVSRGSGPTVTWRLLGNFSMINATTQNSNPAGAKFVFARAGTQTLTLGAGNTLTALPIEVEEGATLNMGTSVLMGSGIFILRSGATLGTALSGGLDSSIQITGTATFSKGASYSFSGSTAQLTGQLLPDTVSTLVINNNAGVTLSHAVVVLGTLEMKSGALSLGGHLLSYGPLGSLRYSGAAAQTTGDVEFPVSLGPKDLTVANTSGVALHASRTVGSLSLLGKLTLGANTLTTDSIFNPTSTRFVVTSGVGVLRLTSVGSSQRLLPIGTSSAYAPVWIINSGTVDTIGARVESDAVAAPQGGRVNVKWNVSENTVGGGDYTLQLGWLTSLEDAAFRANRAHNAHIFNMADTTEAGTNGSIQFAVPPFYISRASITTLGTFAVGRFKDVPDGVEQTDNAPGVFSLSQNYPNPFNPTTVISYQLPAKSDVTLKVYDIVGREVRTLVQANQNAGQYSIQLDGNNLSSGVYFYRLQAGDFSSIKKLVLMK